MPDTQHFLQNTTNRFSTTPRAAARAPGRVNLIGEHVDYSGGVVMPIAIPQACYAAILPTATPDHATISSSSADDETTFNPAEPLNPGADAPTGSWPAYILGVVAGFQRLTDTAPLAGHRIHVHTEVPLGAGLSSSAALEVAVAFALASFLNHNINPLDLAKLCQQAEHEYAGVPCGLMDQAASALAQKGHALLLDCADLSTDHAPVMPSAKLLVFNSGVRHALADGAYAQRRAACEAAAAQLNVQHLAHAPIQRLAELTGTAAERALPFARHVISEQARVLEAKQALDAADAPRFGALMNASHASLRDDFQVSCKEIDALVDAMQAVQGCHGARMTGGGFGGCVIALTEPDAEANVRAAAESRRTLCPDLQEIPVHAAQGASVLI